MLLLMEILLKLVSVGLMIFLVIRGENDYIVLASLILIVLLIFLISWLKKKETNLAD